MWAIFDCLVRSCSLVAAVLPHGEPESPYLLRGRKGPCAIENLLPRLVHADRVVPTFGDRQVIDALAVPAEMDGVGTVLVGLGGRVVVAVPSEIVGFEIPVGIVDSDGPERITGTSFTVNAYGVLPSFFCALPQT